MLGIESTNIYSADGYGFRNVDLSGLGTAGIPLNLARCSTVNCIPAALYATLSILACPGFAAKIDAISTLAASMCVCTVAFGYDTPPGGKSITNDGMLDCGAFIVYVSDVTLPYVDKSLEFVPIVVEFALVQLLVTVGADAPPNPYPPPDKLITILVTVYNSVPGYGSYVYVIVTVATAQDATKYNVVYVVVSVVD